LDVFLPLLLALAPLLLDGFVLVLVCTRVNFFAIVK
jgi:hypothetical protein